MATGANDANGVWQYGEDDSNPTFSALLNRLASSVSTVFTAYKAASPRTVANAAARNAMFPTPVQGNAVFRNDLGYIERYYGLYNVSTNPGGLSVAGWYRDLGRGQRALLGSGSRNYALGGSNVATSYTDLPGMTTTVTTSGLPVMITTTITIRNAASGTARNATFRLFDGATQLAEAGPVPVSYQTTLDHTTITFYHQYTPTAASRTIKIQGITATGAAVQFISGEIKVEEIYQ